jgi:hypothetical protein
MFYLVPQHHRPPSVDPNDDPKIRQAGPAEFLLQSAELLQWVREEEAAPWSRIESSKIGVLPRSEI